MELPFKIPDAWLPVLGGLILWFGLCYLYFAPALTERAIAQYVAAECADGINPAICDCVLEDIKTGSSTIKNAVFLSTFTLSDRRIDLFGNKRNPFIEYIALEMNSPKRRSQCGAAAPLATKQVNAINALKLGYQTKLEDEKRQNLLHLERAKAANEKLEKQLVIVREAVTNNVLTDELRQKAAQLLRIKQLQDDSLVVVLDWWDSINRRAAKKRRDFDRGYN